MWYWHGMGIWGWMMIIVITALVIVLTLWAFRSTMPPQRDRESPFRILDERLARGEIDREEYEERRRVLQANR